jgi:hypothetical protein
MKSLDTKIQKIRSNSYHPKDFIIADAKDADMAGGRRAPGYVRNIDGSLSEKFESFQHYLDKMESLTDSKLVDVMLMSATAAERLVNKNIFAKSPVTPAIRLNDTSCIWGMIRNGEYAKEKSRAFATTQLRHAIKFVDLGLYSMTFNKDVDLDVKMLNYYKDFRDEAEKIGMRHFLEVFNSAVIGLNNYDMGEYVNDCILKTLAGQVNKEKPLFLKIAYNGPKAMEELASYDPGNLIVGILGGGKGTTRDCFELVFQAQKYGARVALFGRKINLSEDQNLIVTCMRKVVEGQFDSYEGVKFYHDSLIKKDLKADRNLNDDLLITEEVLKS